MASTTTSSTVSSTTTTTATAQAAPGGIYVGYYLEDKVSNPEDPTPGAFFLNLPQGNATFAGNMYFTYVGCQTANVGEVSGTKTDSSLVGNWLGTLDGVPNSGSYQGNFNSATGSYSGVYTNAGGKQFIRVAGCIEYYVAPNGTWEMFPVEQNHPAGFRVNHADTTLSWDTVAGASRVLVYVLDAAVARSGTGNPVKWQTILPGNATAVDLTPAALCGCNEYIAGVMVIGADTSRLAFGSKTFIAPETP